MLSVAHPSKNYLRSKLDMISHSVLTSSQVYTPDNALLQLNTHNLIEVDLIVEGRGIHCVHDQEMPCKEGDVFVIPQNTSHGYFLEGVNDALTLRRLSFDISEWFEGDVATPGKEDFCYGVFRENPALACAVLNSSVKDIVLGLYNAIEYEINKKKNQWQDAVNGYLTILLINIGRYVDYAIKDVHIASATDWKTVLSTIKIVNEDYGDSSLTLKSIAEQLFVSETHLSSIFKKTTGKRFSEYLRGVRLERACELLAKTDMRVEQIVAECGLRDVPSFYKNFSAYMNMTPNEYRRSTSVPDSEEYERLLKKEKTVGVLAELLEKVQSGSTKGTKALVQKALDLGVKPADIMNGGLLSGMSIIGEKFKNNEAYVPEVLGAARAVNEGMQILKPYLVEQKVVPVGRAVIGTVQGDLHDIGKNLVKMMLEGKGIEVVDLGTDVKAEDFVNAAIEHDCQIICCSALLTTTMGVMGDVVKAAEAAGIRDKVKIMIGGAPVSEELCRQIGADVYALDAASAANIAIEFLSE